MTDYSINKNAAVASKMSTLMDEKTAVLTGPAHLMLKRLREKEFSATELLEWHFNRVDQLNDQLNIIVDQDRERAMAAARRVDRLRALDKPIGVLAGLPMTIKDSFEVVGMKATCGLPHLANHRPKKDAILVKRIRDAGASIFGKTNLPAGCGDHQSYNDIYGVTNNPWNIKHTVGGSSGGSAASLAAGFTALELGSDIGGSIRCPSHFCGVFGHKPTYGVLPVVGHIPPGPFSTSPSPLSVMGPLARDASDLRLLFGVLCGLHESDDSAVSHLPPQRYQTLREYKVGVWLDAFPLDEGYAKAILQFVEDLRQEGVNVDIGVHPDIDPQDIHDTYLKTLFGVIGSRMEKDVKEAFLAQAQSFEGKQFAKELYEYTKHPAHESESVNQSRAENSEKWKHFFQQYDVLICPVTSTVAFEHQLEGHGPSAQIGRVLTISGQQAPYLYNLSWPGLATLANLPATAMPTGYLVNGLPAGVQIIGDLYQDHTTLAFAEMAARQLNPFSCPPLSLDKSVA
ncbi:amidase family protein [Marinomonas spartinae]|uniref:amidase family protein n=1 Tax=Marinomonas spartinae TaxID=1792290 RepID=UPI0018F1B207|nr:amidase family protein [Marinomonas spartinae]MBJ7553912.1 glutamyl-tRNA amidotransferase [Marinomonas spartinae]